MTISPGVTVSHLLLMVCALALLDFNEALAQSSRVAWPPLSNVSASPLYAERAPGPFDLSAMELEPGDTVPRQIKPTYWKEGGIIGAIMAGSFLAYLFHGLCASSDSSAPSCAGALVGGIVMGGGLGFISGALVGGQFDKNPKPAAADSAQVR